MWGMDAINLMYAAQCIFNAIFIDHFINKKDITRIRSGSFILYWIFITFYEIASIRITFLSRYLIKNSMETVNYIIYNNINILFKKM